jgi:hypothetical protein
MSNRGKDSIMAADDTLPADPIYVIDLGAPADAPYAIIDHERLGASGDPNNLNVDDIAAYGFADKAEAEALAATYRRRRDRLCMKCDRRGPPELHIDGAPGWAFLKFGRTESVEAGWYCPEHVGSARRDGGFD